MHSAVILLFRQGVNRKEDKVYFNPAEEVVLAYASLCTSTIEEDNLGVDLVQAITALRRGHRGQRLA
jgi:hypothetical protein